MSYRCRSHKEETIKPNVGGCEYRMYAQNKLAIYMIHKYLVFRIIKNNDALFLCISKWLYINTSKALGKNIPSVK